MIKILLVEDEQARAQKVCSILRGLPGVPPDAIEVVPDAFGAKRALRDAAVDILLLDIQIPKRFGEMPEPEGGLRLLQELSDGMRYHLPAHVIGLTAYIDSYRAVSEEFRNTLWGLLYLDESSVAWEEVLRRKIEFIASAKRSSVAGIKNHLFDVGVICALHDPELKAMLDHDCAWAEFAIPGDHTQYKSGRAAWNNRSLSLIMAALPQMGMPAAAVLATKMTMQFRPRLLAMVGIAAGKPRDTRIADIIVPDMLWDYGSGKVEDLDGKQVLRPDPRPLPLEPAFKEWFQNAGQNAVLLQNVRARCHAVKPAHALRIHVGPVASGAAVVASAEVWTQVQSQQRKVVGIEMEGYSVFYAAMNLPPPRPLPVVIKAVSDFGTRSKGKKSQDRYRQYASQASVEVLFEFLAWYAGSLSES